ncbi:hypothetical protein OQA88_7218 [Cercophora sp. LCS_1]
MFFLDVPARQDGAKTLPHSQCASVQGGDGRWKVGAYFNKTHKYLQYLFGTTVSTPVTSYNIIQMTDTANDNACITGIVASVASLSPDVWYLILQNVTERKDLASLSRVCKGLYPLATRFLYRTITIGPLFLDLHPFEWLRVMHQKEKSEDTAWVESLALVRRLATDRNPGQTRAVREINIEPFHNDWGDEDIEDVRPLFEEELPGFVGVLQNLHHVRIFTPSPAFEALFRALQEHPNKPEIHLLKEDASRAVSGPMPGVTTIKAEVSPWGDTRAKPNTQIPDVERLLFACPNLKSLSLSVLNNYGGCMRPRIHHAVVENFQFASGGDVFPPLESLSLSGYHMDADEEREEWPHWRDGLDWSRLKTLSLGPHPYYSDGPPMADLLKKFKGHATTLRSLTIKTWADEGDDICLPLNSFLTSFATLEELTVKRHLVPVEDLASHSGLKRLCLHCMEVKRPEETPRPTLSVTDLALLDASCPDLETLEIDISRDSTGEWPKDIVEALAGSFSNLLHLTLHCEIGLEFDWNRNQKEPYLPLLDEALVRTLAEPFFASRGASKMTKLTIKTGEELRRFPQWHPQYRRLEESATYKFDAWLRRSDRVVKVKASDAKT